MDTWVIASSCSLSSPSFNEVLSSTPECITYLFVSPVLSILCTIVLLFRLAIQCTGTSPRLHYTSQTYSIVSLIPPALCIVSCLIPLFLINTIIASNGHIGNIEALSLGASSVVFAILAVLFLLERSSSAVHAQYTSRVVSILVSVCEFTRFGLSSSGNNYGHDLLVISIVCQSILSGICLLYHPSEWVWIVPPEEGYMELEGSEEPHNICPEAAAGFWSTTFFSWMSPLVSTGYDHPLQDSDVWDLNNRDKAATLQPQFDAAWEHEFAAHGSKISLWRVVNRAFWKRFWLGALFKIGNDASQFVGPLFLAMMIDFIDDPSAPNWHGYVFAGAIFAGQILGAVSEAQYFQNVMRVGMRIRSSLITAIFRKSMMITNDARNSMSTGRINNLMSSDAESLQQLTENFHQIWSAPCRIIVALVLLYRELGYSALVGCSILLTLLPVQKKIFEISKRLVSESRTKADERVKIINEVLEAASVVKTYAWEESFEERVRGIRDSELAKLLKAALLGATNSFVIFSVPLFVSVLSFAVYAATGNELTPAKAFSSLALFDVLRFPMFTLPNAVNQLITAQVAIDRIVTLLLSPEIEEKEVEAIAEGEPVIEICDGSFSWTGEEQTLSNINMTVGKGELVAIIGSTGQGKSSIVSAILGEIPAIGPVCTRVRGSIAYVPQQAWIFNDTLRENVLFGNKFDRSKYDSCVKVSSLRVDLDMMGSGDATEIGERGINLSGGQKQRVSIARAVYSDADVFLLDDPLSALDAHVARQVFEKCIVEHLREKTVVLVTNQVQFVSQADRIVLVDHGRITATGTYSQLMNTSSDFQQLMSKQTSEKEAEKDTEVVDAIIAEPDKSRRNSQASKKNDSSAALISKEERVTGGVSLSILNAYSNALGGIVTSGFILSLFVLSEVLRTGGSVWLTIWSTRSIAGMGTASYISIYCAWNLVNALCILGYKLLLARYSIDASRMLHEGMFHRLLGAPMSFFHQTPIGRIINRFTKDQADVDTLLVRMLSLFVSGFMQFVGTLAVIMFYTPLVIVLFIPIMVIFFKTGAYFQRTNRELKRLDAITRSPVYAHFSQCLNGISSIRAYRARANVTKDNSDKIDHTIRINLAMVSSNRWLSLRLELLGGIMILITSIFIVYDRNKIAASVAGLSLGYALGITALMNRNIRLFTLAENSFNSVERILYYSDVPQESDAAVTEYPHTSWPKEGSIKFSSVSMRYREDLPLVLNNLSFSILASQKVGIVGRTGAGKSSLFIALYRLVELSSGTISIDGVDISRIGLKELRTQLSIIPQDPVLFTGTVRFNLDPFNAHSDSELWDALRRAHLDAYIRSQGLGLDTLVEERGSNFSVGQRQLICMARALLRRSKILVLDEATASVDVNTDSLIQTTIRDEFSHCTILIIAHRLNTIIDCDAVLVMDQGKCKEFGTAAELLDNPKGIFTSMVDSTGPVASAFLREAAYARA